MTGFGLSSLFIIIATGNVICYAFGWWWRGRKERSRAKPVLQWRPPPGWRAVPIDPTDAMVETACDDGHKAGEIIGLGTECPYIARRRRAWAEMLNAAPRWLDNEPPHQDTGARRGPTYVDMTIRGGH